MLTTFGILDYEDDNTHSYSPANDIWDALNTTSARNELSRNVGYTPTARAVILIDQRHESGIPSGYQLFGVGSDLDIWATPDHASDIFEAIERGNF